MQPAVAARDKHCVLSSARFASDYSMLDIYRWVLSFEVLLFGEFDFVI